MGKFIFKAIYGIILVLSMVYGLKNQERKIVKPDKKFQIIVIFRNTRNGPNSDILLHT